VPRLFYKLHFMIGKFAYSVEVKLLNFTAQSQNEFKDLAANTLLNPANKPDLVVAIVGIESYYASIYAFSTSGRPVVTQADSSKLAVTFNVANDEPLYYTPYLDFNTLLNYGRVKEIEPTPINLQKSYVVVQNALANNTFSALFNFWYEHFTKAEWVQVEAAIKARKLKYGK